MFSISCHAQLQDGLERLKKAYPNQIKSYDDHDVVWSDHTRMLIGKDKSEKMLQEKLDSPSFYDQLTQSSYVAGKPINANSFHPVNDAGRIRYEPFFRKMYGNTVQAVMKKLVTIYWMPSVFGKRYPLLVTTINGVNIKLTHISKELEQLVQKHPEFLKYLRDPGGAFNWRTINHTNRLSAHSFGMSIDINPAYSNYWQSDLERMGQPISEASPLTYKSDIPWDIVVIFENHGFIWGGKWYHYDTMHFEYRPEMFVSFRQICVTSYRPKK